MFLPLLQETRKKQEIPGDVFSPAPRNTRELVSQKGLMEIGM